MKGKKRMRQFLMISIVMFLFSGCAAVHVQELKRLQAFGVDQAEMDEEVAERNDRFDQLSNEVQAGNLSQYPDRAAFREHYGEPLFIKQVREGADEYERWLYRYARAFESDKVYVYFDKGGQAVKWIRVPLHKEKKPDASRDGSADPVHNP